MIWCWQQRSKQDGLKDPGDRTTERCSSFLWERYCFKVISPGGGIHSLVVVRAGWWARGRGHGGAWAVAARQISPWVPGASPKTPVQLFCLPKSLAPKPSLFIPHTPDASCFRSTQDVTRRTSALAGEESSRCPVASAAPSVVLCEVMRDQEPCVFLSVFFCLSGFCFTMWHCERYSEFYV